MIFFTNLSKPAYDHHEVSGTDPQGWLLSSHRTTRAEAGRAQHVRGQDELLMADNGTIVHIRESTGRFENEADAVVELYRAHRASLPGRPRDLAIAAVPLEIRRPAATTADAIADDADAEFGRIDPATQTDVQRSIGPTHLICKEDWSIAVALGLGLERNLTGWSIDRYVTRNRQSLRGWREASSTGDPGCADYVTLAAPDYPTARAVAREAAAWGVENVALGFAGLNSTPGYTEITRRPHRRKLDCAGPRRYVRLAEIVTGFRDGYRESDGTLQRFHALGLGARQMWPILAAGLDWWTEISIDATSAIKDTEGRRPVLYDPTHLAGRVPIVDVVNRVIETGQLPFPSPVLEPHLAAIDLTAAAGWVADNGPATHDDLRGGRPLAAMVPLFINGTGSSAAGRLHAQHNYWASEVAAASVPSRGRRRWAMTVLEQLGEGGALSVTVRNGVKAALEVLA